MSLLHYIYGLPLLGALLVWLVPRQYRWGIRLIALASALGALAVALLVFTRFDLAQTGYQFVQKIPWVKSLGISLHVGVDGINLGLLLMGALVTFAAVCVSRNIQEREKEFYLLLLVMSGGILGAFASLDLFFLYFFHELALVPTFIMIGVWGRGERRNYATFQITLYLSLGALVALIGLIMLYLQSGIRSFDLVELTRHFQNQPLALSQQQLIFPFLLFGFGILVSLWPFHSWAPLGYGTAPAATAMMHAGVIKKFGLYGLIRIALPVLPLAAWSWLEIISILCLGNILYCGWVAMRQRDLNLLIGNSSVAHMGFCFLGIASLSVAGITGCVLVMVAHGLLAALTFGLSGYLHQQARTLEIKDLGGLWQRMPFVGAALMMAMFAGCGLPGFANFPGELLVMFGAWKMLPMAVTLAAWGALVIAAIYMLRAVREVLHGPLAPRWISLSDLASPWQKTPFALLLAALLIFGFFPSLLTRSIEPAVRQMVQAAGYEVPLRQPGELTKSNPAAPPPRRPVNPRP